MLNCLIMLKPIIGVVWFGLDSKRKGILTVWGVPEESMNVVGRIAPYSAIERSPILWADSLI